MDNQTKKSGNGFPFTQYFQDNACPDCEGGSVDLMINGEFVETIVCSTCTGQGWLVPSKRAEIMDGHRELQAAITNVFDQEDDHG